MVSVVDMLACCFPDYVEPKRADVDNCFYSHVFEVAESGLDRSEPPFDH